MEDLCKLKGFPLFSELHKPELEKIAQIIRREHYPKGARIFAEDDPGDLMYLIESGRVRISKTPPGYGEEALAILGPGNVFGEMALLDREPRSATALAQEEAELLVIDRAALEGLFFVDKELAYYVLTAMLRVLAARVREMNDKLVTVFLMARFC